jgi:polysaccharide export outer membrane protein
MRFPRTFLRCRKKMKMKCINSGCASAPRGLESGRVMQRIPNFLSHLLNLVVVLGIVGLLQVALAQSSGPVQDATHQGNVTTEPSRIATRPLAGSPEQKTAPPANSSALVIGPGDEVEVAVYGAPDLSGHTRVSADGNISMPLIGYVRIAGLSSSEAEAAIETQLQQNNIVNDPQVSVYIKEYTSSGISVAGEVNRPGVYSALGPHRLFDILQTAGGLSEKASGSVTISHKGNEENPVTVELSKNPAEMVRSNVALHPGDTVFVAKAAMVYVLGEVNRPGAYILNSTGAVTVLQLVAAAGGPTHTAAVGGTRMLRRTPSGLQELPVPLKALLRGKTADIPISAEDILFVPSSRMKDLVAASSVVATSTATAAIYRVF